MNRTIPALLVAVVCSVLVQAQSPSKMNVIYILADDLGYSELGCYGNQFNETPNLDRMAKEGMRFTQFYAPAPVCSPYRAALMSGQHPARLHITDYLRPNAAQHLDLGLTTLAEMFKNNGYKTGIVGKWHLSGYTKDGAAEETLPNQHGFDEVIVSETEGIGEGTYFWPYHFNTDIKKRLPAEHEFLTDRQNLEAVEFIERNKNAPFFLYLTHYATHTSLHGKPELVDHFRKKAGAGKSEPSPKNPENDPYKKWPADYKAKQNNPHLAAMLYSIDEGVGAIFSKLKQLGLDKNTLVIFTSDNGGEVNITTNAPLRGGKSMLYEGGVREPFIIWKPGTIKANTVCTEPVVNMDIYPTMMQLTGGAKPVQELEGKSLMPLLKNSAAHLPARNFYWHYPLDKPHFLGGRSAGGIRSGDWKLIMFYDDGHKELYNLKGDPGESRDLSSANPKKVKELQAKFEAWKKAEHAD